VPRASRTLSSRASTVALALALGGATLGGTVLAAPETAQAQRMSLALSRLSRPNDMADPCVAGATVCADQDAWRSVMTQLSGALIPPLIEPARTRGPRSFYLGVETMLTGIENTSDYWQRATEGDGAMADRNRSVDSVFTWTRLSLRKPLPFGFEIGTSAGYLVNTDYFTLGLEIRWALLEGWTGRDWWVPDLAVRAAVQTLVGDAQFNTTVVAIDATLSNSVVIGDAFELSPYIAGQINWAFADSELVDLTPERDAFAECDPDPAQPDGMRTVCRGPSGGSDFNNNTVFPSLRTMRPRLVGGVQARYELITLNAAFSFDLLTPREADSSLPASLPRQWRLDLGLGFSY
jgi:hypothetical protein